MKSAAHQQAMVAEDPSQQSLTEVKMKLNEQEKKSYIAAMKVVYWLATEEIANQKYPRLLNLLRVQGVKDVIQLKRGKNSTKESPTSFYLFLKSINEVILGRMLKEVQNSPFIGIGLDESTDRSNEKHVVFIIRYVGVDQVKTTFLKVACVDDGKALTLYQTMCKVLQEYKIPIKKITGLGIDGASVMLSDRNGVCGLLHRDNPFAVALHCVCHRLHLVLSSVTETLEEMKTDQGNGHFLKAFLETMHGDTNYYGIPISVKPGRGANNVSEREQFERDRVDFIDGIVANIKSRFPTVDLLEAMQIFDPSCYPPNNDQLNSWGVTYLETLLAHFGERHDTTNQVFDPLVDEMARGEFLVFKRLVAANKGDQEENNDFFQPQQLFKKIFGRQYPQNRKIYPEMFKLMSIAMCVMPSNAEAERAFSLQNRIKNKLRTRITTDHLDQLMRVAYCQLDLDSFDFQSALDHYSKSPHRWY
ncbi:hypothetical protein HOLleu_18474 [Holothuria leucospilota]|uniref:Uncharacterized protein n=1 Tax=Holothuria leucospilota TaxID=206669 RepID=A0A9Q1C3R0_HOLLE|nr:hypothetical protein HOLleu_18474 [Holothuria leucospilota]